MQIKETLSQGLKRDFEVKITAEEIENKLIARLDKIGKKVKISGFRPGKVPMNILKQRYKDAALAEVLEESAESAVQKIVTEQNIKPSLKPAANIISFEEGQDLDLSIHMEILPKIDEINLDNLSFEKYVVSVPKDSILGVLENFARKSRETRSLKDSRPSQKGDILIIDFEGSIDNKPIEGASAKDHALELGSGAFIAGFEDQLIGKEKGSRAEVNVTFPEDYHESKYAGKPARFDVLIKDIQEADPIKIDSKLAIEHGFESLEAMESAVEKSIAKNYIDHSFLNTKRHVLDALAERFIFEVPQNMVEIEFKNIWEQLLRELGILKEKASNTNQVEGEAREPQASFEEIAGKSEEILKEEYKIIAERRVRLGLLLAEIGNRHNIVITNQELLDALKNKAKEFPGQEREVFEFYRNNESAMATLRAPIFENKVIEFILSQSKVTEKKVTPEELERLLSIDEEEAEKRIASQSQQKSIQ